MLGPRPGARKRANKLNVNGLGRSLVNQQKKEKQARPDSERYTTEINPYGSGSTLQSVTEQRPLDELLSTAEMSGKDFTTERTAAVLVVKNPTLAATSGTQLSEEEREELVLQHYENAGKLTVPRRPKWTRDMKALELDRLEKDAFLAWRRSLASLQEDPKLRLAITPFERNIEVWRQLWRVIERSDLVVQIVDARNPQLYRSEDLDTYVKSFKNKNTLLLVNKADLLTDNQRELWHEHFVKHNITFAFFSAKKSSENLDADSADTENSGDVMNLQNITNILTVSQLEALFIQAAPKISEEELEETAVATGNKNASQLQIGLVGYPNVGKSSTINALIGAKKVSVSSTPGKTKHFQTIQLSPELMLCDCPGLVFPNFAQTKGELVCQGVLPIDQLRDHMSPTALVVDRIPRAFLERTYGIKLHTDPVTALDLLETYAKYRGYTRTGGGADSSRSARLVLKDYVNARLPFCTPPPNYEGSPQDFNKELFELIISDAEVEGQEESACHAQESRAVGMVPTGKLAEMQMESDMLEDELDRDFFAGTDDRGTASLPFHLRNKAGLTGAKTYKKHNKGRKTQAF